MQKNIKCITYYVKKRHQAKIDFEGVKIIDLTTFLV